MPYSRELERKTMLSIQPLLAVAWALVAAYRAGQGDWNIAFLDFYIAFLTFILWEERTGRV